MSNFVGIFKYNGAIAKKCNGFAGMSGSLEILFFFTWEHYKMLIDYV